ncbi:MAG: hypothetical protein AAF687_06540 [Pseudomonadota bacterium]
MTTAKTDETETIHDKDASLEFISTIPVVGPAFALSARLSGRGRRNLLYFIAILVIYPVLAFSLVLVILRYSPSSIQEGARNFVLSSLGVEKTVRDAISQNNEFIDYAAVVNFDAKSISRTPYRQNLRVGQEVQMRADLFVSDVATIRDEDECWSFQFPNNLNNFGVVQVSAERAHAALTFPVTKLQGQLGLIDKDQWETIESGLPADMYDKHVTLEWTWTPSEELAKSDPFGCIDADLSVGLTVFKG